MDVAKHPYQMMLKNRLDAVLLSLFLRQTLYELI